MLSTNLLAQILVLLAAASGFAGLFFWLWWKQRPTPRVIPVRAQNNGRYYSHQAVIQTPTYNMAPATRDAVVNSMNDGMIVLDNRDRIIDINPAARQIIQQSTVTVVGKQLNHAWPALSRHYQVAKTRPLDIALDLKNAKRFYELSIMPFYTGQEEQPGRLLILRDITERKKMENMRDDLTRTMVHDLRDPISNALFALEMLKTTMVEGGSPDAQQLLDLTFASTAKTLQLVDKILEIGRLESGEMPLTLTAISLAEMVTAVLAAQTPRAINKQLRLVNDVSDSLPSVWADAGLLERILKNLVDNSIKFTPVGGTIQVTAVQHLDDKTNEPGLLVSVTDTGPGIPAELASKIFGQFITGQHVESGSGLGLAFCKMALAAHGQDIWVDNAPGQGATMTFSLPVPSDS